ncbi:MAG: ORF6N domain-containing protein [Elusimicrobia bacterium]|nr:ORF6N domain-containing protein [Elusimicrobiota bacterium]
MTHLITTESIERKIFIIRGHRVILDKDLAVLYGVKAIALRQQVKRNRDRFPADFMFQLTKKEAEILVSQNVIPSKRSLGGYLPYAFTQNGVAMLSSVLNSKKAIHVNIQIMRAFTRLRELISTHKELSHKLAELERRIENHDEHIHSLFEAIRQLMSPPEPKRRRIGFRKN